MTAVRSARIGSPYEDRVVSPEEAVSHVRSGDRIWISVGQQVGLLVAALLGRADELEDVEVVSMPNQDFGWFGDGMQERIRLSVLFSTFLNRDAINSGRADLFPYWGKGGTKALDDGRPEASQIDVTFISVSPPNEHGYCCFGNTIWDAKSGARHAKTVIALVYDDTVRTYGDTWIHQSEIDWFVESPEPRAEMLPGSLAADPWDMPIAESVASLIKDGDTIQIGTGTTTAQLPASGFLDSKRDLGYFGELTVPGTIDLVKRGVITSRHMATHPGKFITTSAGNSPDDVAFIANNPMFEFYEVSYTHDPIAIARNPNMVAINNALAVDLTGQIAASTIGARVWSGTGGQLSYAIGAFLSPGGRSICVLPSTAVGGSRSRIVAQFEQGQVTTVPRDLADTVVTEFGIAHLLNKSVRQRAEELISVAHPDFRHELRRQAKTLWGPS